MICLSDLNGEQSGEIGIKKKENEIGNCAWDLYTFTFYSLYV